MKIQRIELNPEDKVPQNCKLCKHYGNRPIDHEHDPHYCKYLDNTKGTRMSIHRLIMLTPEERGWKRLPVTHYMHGCEPPDFCPLKSQSSATGDV